MERVSIELNHYNFFCPVTGERILDSEQFNPSPAQVFCYLEGEGVFEYVNPSLYPILKEIGVDTDSEYIYADWETFEKLLLKLNGINYVLFELTDRGIACGPVCMTTYHCIDWDYDLDEE
jgi:hypothetical protein